MKRINLAYSYAEKILKEVNQFLENEKKLVTFSRWRKKAQIAKEVMKNFLTIFFLYGLTEMQKAAKHEKMKQIGLEIGLNLAKEFFGFGKQTFNDQIKDKKIKTLLHENLKKTKWKQNGITLTQILCKGFIGLEKIKNSGQNLTIAAEIGSFAAGICLVESLEKEIPRHLFLVRKKRRAKLSKLREELFFMKLDFVYFLHTQLRIIMPYKFNHFIQNLNYLFE